MKRSKTRGGKRGRLGRVLAALDLPEESNGRVPKLTWLGRSDLLIENHRGILHYGGTTVRFSTEAGPLEIAGRALRLLELGASRAYVRGEIDAASYRDEAGHAPGGGPGE